MRSRISIAVSAVAHGVTVAVASWWGCEHEPDPPPPPPEEPTISIEEVDPAPIDVALAPVYAPEPPAETHAPAAATPAAKAAPTDRRAITTTTGPGVSETAPPSSRDHGGGDLLKMRLPTVDLTMPPAVLDMVAKQTKELPAPVEPTGKLEPSGNGTAEIRDRVVTVHVHQDGTLDMRDRPNLEAHWALPIPSPRALGTMISKWAEDPYAQTRVGRVQDLAPHEQVVPGGWDSGLPTDNGNYKPPSGGTIPILGGSFDLTDWIMRKAHVGDPYQARKHKLATDTLDERVERGAAYRASRLAKSAETMQKNLDVMWRATTDPAERREALFELWDECAEGEGVLGESGERARAQVIGWIRGHLPAGSPGAFTPDDIARFDKNKTSKQHFHPYE